LQAQFKLQVKESIHCHPYKLMSTSWLMSLEVAAKGSCSLQAHRQPAWPPTSRPTGQAGSPPAHPWDRARGQAAHRVGPCQPAHGPGTGQGRGLPMSPPPPPAYALGGRVWAGPPCGAREGRGRATLSSPQLRGAKGGGGASPFSFLQPPSPRHLGGCWGKGSSHAPPPMTMRMNGVQVEGGMTLEVMSTFKIIMRWGTSVILKVIVRR
jgi:hypothetical protein